MLQNIRNGLRGWFAYLLVGFFVAVFVLFGANALFLGGLSRGVVAEVNGRKISDWEVRRTMDIRKQQMQRMLGDKIDPRYLTDEFLRDPTEQMLIQRLILVDAAQQSGLRVASSEIDRQIREDPSFAKDGVFDPEYYKSVLQYAYGYTPVGYREELRQDRVLKQYQDAFVNTAFVLDREIADTASLQYEKRDFDYAVLPLAKTMESVTLSEDEINAYYQQHQDAFMSNPRIAIEYLVLDKDALTAHVAVSEEDVKAQYDAEVAAAQEKTERHAAHILVKEQADGSHQKILEEIQKRLAAGEDFAALAKQYSTDTGSAQNGGDVGTTTGDSFVEEFETALRSLAVGEVSAPVKTRFGYHLIKLLDQAAVKVPTLEQSRARITAAVRQQLADEKYQEKLEELRDLSKTATSLSSLASEMSDDEVSLEHGQIPLFSRKQPMLLFAAHAALRNNLVLNTLFGNDLHEGWVTDVLEPEPRYALVMRVTEHQPEALLPLVAVHDAAEQRARRDKASAALSLEASSLLQEILSGSAMADVARQHGLDLVKLQDISRQAGIEVVDGSVLEAAFGLARPAADKPVTDVAELSNGNWVLLQVRASRLPVLEALSDDQRHEVGSKLLQASANRDFTALMALWTSQAKVVRRSKATQ